MIDLNTADLQGTGAGVIPPGSIVPLTLTIRPPRAGKEGSHELLCRSDKGNEFLDIEFEADGQFAGRKIWQNLTVRGSDKAAAISMRTLRAVVESARGIDPHDASPAATASRKLNDWADLNGMTFLARLGCELERGYKDGRWYVNNIIKQIITPDMKEYPLGEQISDSPIPQVPQDDAPCVGQPAPAPSWGAASPSAPAASARQPVQAPSQQPAGPPVPAWAQR